MPRQSIDAASVARAAQQLQDEGRPVSLRSVRERLGHGSLTTIQTHLSAWRASQPAPGIEIPPAIVNAIAGELAAAVAKGRESVDGELADARALIQELREDVARTSEALSSAKAEALEAKRRAASAVGAEVATGKQLKKAEAAAESARSDARDAERKAAKLEGALELAKKQGEDMAAELAASRARIAELEAQVAAAARAAKKA